MTNYLVKNIRVAIYVRVSTQEQAKEGYSIGEQTDRLKKFCEAHDWLVVNVYTDAGHSGADTNRPALQSMLSDIRSGKIDKVLVYKLDRLSRSQKDTLTLIENEFLPHNTDFESMSEKLDTSTPQGRLFLGILAAFAQLEREVIKERMSMGIAARIKEGKWKGGGHVPFGYDYEPSLDKLVVNEWESMIVKEIYDMYLQGIKINSISNKLDEIGHALKNGKSDPRRIKYILSNKTYCGYIKQKEDWIKGLHDAIIDESSYETVEKMLKETHERYMASGYKAESTTVTSYLGGFLHCSRCGARYSRVKYKLANKDWCYIYSCYSRSKKSKHMIVDPNCKNTNHKMHVLDQAVFDEIKKLAMDPEYIRKIKSEKLDITAAEKVTLLEGQIKQINTQISRFMDLYGIGRFTIEELDEKIAPLQDQRTKLQQEVDKLKVNIEKMPVEEVKMIAESFDSILKKGDLIEIRSIIEQLIERIDIDGEEITIHWNFA